LKPLWSDGFLQMPSAPDDLVDICKRVRQTFEVRNLLDLTLLHVLVRLVCGRPLNAGWAGFYLLPLCRSIADPEKRWWVKWNPVKSHMLKT